jgi:hypothetical protein
VQVGEDEEGFVAGGWVISALRETNDSWNTYSITLVARRPTTPSMHKIVERGFVTASSSAFPSSSGSPSLMTCLRKIFLAMRSMISAGMHWSFGAGFRYVAIGKDHAVDLLSMLACLG